LWRRGAALEPPGQIGDVRWVEADGGAEVDNAQLTPLNEALHGPRMDVKQLSRLLCREQRRKRARLRQDSTGCDRRTRRSLPLTAAGVSLSRFALPR
jgi:hypothetical protein